MSEELQEDTKKSSKEIWLFLIFVDIVALCVFGYFIYKSFFNGVGMPFFSSRAVVVEKFSEDITVEAEPEIKEQAAKPAVKPAEALKPAAPAPTDKEVFIQPQEAAKEDVKPAETAAKAEPAAAAKPAETAPVKAEPVAKTEPAAAKAEPKRQSVFVSGTGKTRKVTFKYYGNAKKVSIISGFTMRKPMSLKKMGNIWATTLVIYPGEYKYMFIVDGKEIPDPNAAKQVDGRSVVVIK